MPFSRRDFFKHSFLFSTALWSLKSFGSYLDNSFSGTRLPILQGATTLTTTQINVLSTHELTFTILDSDGIPSSARLTSELIKKSYSPWMSYRIFIQNLEAGVNYQLVVTTLDGKTVDTRTFGSLKPNLLKPRIALVSCMRDTKVNLQSSMWAALEGSEPDLLFMLGDNVYVDDGDGKVTEEKIWRRYVETRNTLDLYQLPKLIPTLATWDDHDFGENNTFGSTYWKDASRIVFRALYAQDALVPEVSWGPGVATSFSAYGQRFYLMDNRSFREGKTFGKTHWGSAQEKWLFNSLENNKSPAWLMNGSQFFGGYRMGWSYEGNHATSFKKMLARLKKIKAPVLFASGDVHYSEVMRVEKDHLGYESFEITSSSMHSNAKAPKKGNKRRITSTGAYNFVIANTEVLESGLGLELKSIGSGSKTLFHIPSLKINYQGA